MSPKKNLHFKRGGGKGYLTIILIGVVLLLCGLRTSNAIAFDTTLAKKIPDAISNCINNTGQDTLCLKLPNIKENISNVFDSKSITTEDLKVISKTAVILAANVFLATIETIASIVRTLLSLLK